MTGPVEHWLEDEERWDDEPPDETWEEDELERGYAPWEVRVSCKSHREARELADQLEQEGYDAGGGFVEIVHQCSIGRAPGLLKGDWKSPHTHTRDRGTNGTRVPASR